MCQHGDCQKLAKALAFLSMVCSMSLKHLSKLDSWRTKKVAKYLQQMNSLCKSCHEEIEEQIRELTQGVRDASVVHQLFHLLFTEASSEMFSVEGWLSKKPCLRKANGKKRLRYDKIHNNLFHGVITPN